MSRILKIILGLIFLVLVIIQFIPYERPEVVTDVPGDLLETGEVPVEVARLLKNSCYDCHSSEPVYPWYSYVAPVKWLVINDIRKGQEELNFSNWGKMNIREKIQSLDEMADEVEDEEMPLPIYTVAHRDATLSDSEKERLIAWTNAYAESLIGD